MMMLMAVGRKVAGDISWGKNRRGEGEQNDNNKK